MKKNIALEHGCGGMGLRIPSYARRPYDDGIDGARTLGITRADLGERAQELVAKAGALIRKGRIGKPNQETREVTDGMNELLAKEGGDLLGITITKDEKDMCAYDALIMARAELLSLNDGGCCAGC